MTSMDKVRLCPDCYIDMVVECDAKGRIKYHKCPKCGMQILFTHSGH
ncbi:MAG TPA: hypothetical protein VLL96_04805 [Candidatus Deferrimicrobiaceae bacterium]|nr:hypothetical protein [Candidatus Deferrimicrobiaceae bacterium]